MIYTRLVFLIFTPIFPERCNANDLILHMMYKVFCFTFDDFCFIEKKYENASSLMLEKISNALENYIPFYHKINQINPNQFHKKNLVIKKTGYHLKQLKNRSENLKN